MAKVAPPNCMKEKKDLCRAGLGGTQNCVRVLGRDNANQQGIIIALKGKSLCATRR